MAKNRIIVQFECTECGDRNYSQRVSPKRKYEKLRVSKYCSRCRTHHEHKETK